MSLEPWQPRQVAEAAEEEEEGAEEEEEEAEEHNKGGDVYEHLYKFNQKTM